VIVIDDNIESTRCKGASIDGGMNGGFSAERALSMGDGSLRGPRRVGSLNERRMAWGEEDEAGP
jgi:hypothetical protein